MKCNNDEEECVAGFYVKKSYMNGNTEIEQNISHINIHKEWTEMASFWSSGSIQEKLDELLEDIQFNTQEDINDRKIQASRKFDIIEVEIGEEEILDDNDNYVDEGSDKDSDLIYYSDDDW